MLEPLPPLPTVLPVFPVPSAAPAQSSKHKKKEEDASAAAVITVDTKLTDTSADKEPAPVHGCNVIMCCVCALRVCGSVRS